MIFKAIHKHKDQRYKTIQGLQKALGNAFAPISKDPTKTIDDFRLTDEEGPSLKDLEDEIILPDDAEFAALLEEVARGE